LKKVLSDAPARPRALRPDLPAGLEAVVVKAMAKDPAARYPTATALANDLRRFLAGQTPAAPELSPRRRLWQWLVRRRAGASAAAAAVVMVAALIRLGNLARAGAAPAPDPEQVIRDEIATGKLVRLLEPMAGRVHLGRVAARLRGPGRGRSRRRDLLLRFAERPPHLASAHGPGCGPLPGEGRDLPEV